MHNVLALKRRRWALALRVSYGLFVIVLAAFAPPQFLVPGIILGAVVILYAFLVAPLRFRRAVKRNWDQYPAAHRNFDISLVSDGVESLDHKGNPTHLPWEDFHRSGETDAMFLLYLSPKLTLCLPKRLVLEQDLAVVREVLALIR